MLAEKRQSFFAHAIKTTRHAARDTASDTAQQQSSAGRVVGFYFNRCLVYRGVCCDTAALLTLAAKQCGSGFLMMPLS